MELRETIPALRRSKPVMSLTAYSANPATLIPATLIPAALIPAALIPAALIPAALIPAALTVSRRHRPSSATSSCAILVYQQADARHATASAEEIRCVAADIGLDAEIITAASPADMRSVVRRLVDAGTPRIAVAGGDSSVALAVQDLAHSATALAIVPQGARNKFATALRLPTDVAAALRVVRDGVVREVGLGRFGHHYFTEAAVVGLFADALVHSGAAGENPLRAASTLMRMAQSLHARGLRLTLDGEVQIECAVMCTVANTVSMAVDSAAAPGTCLTGGELDVVVVGNVRRRDLWTYYRALCAQRPGSLPKASTTRAREVRIESRRPMQVHCDDQIVGWTPITIHAEPRALRVLVERA